MPAPSQVNAPVLPFTTGSAKMDSNIRSAVLAISGFLTGAILVWLNKHGVMLWLNANGLVGWISALGFSVDGLVGTVVFTIVLGAASAIWGYLSKGWDKNSVVERSIAAASSGTVAPEIVHAANAEQLQRIVDTGVAKSPAAEEALTAALNKVQTAKV